MCCKDRYYTEKALLFTISTLYGDLVQVPQQQPSLCRDSEVQYFLTVAMLVVSLAGSFTLGIHVVGTLNPFLHCSDATKSHKLKS